MIANRPPKGLPVTDFQRSDSHQITKRFTSLECLSCDRSISGGPDKMASRKAKGRAPTKKRAQRATSNVFAMFDQAQISVRGGV
ncbi:myosin regulatory light chain sqh-like [Tropilaelaps mercedesae]|uniref:Myosin regulatory light chain sqh-like n=1 Tax=Tropilaelaps mercedesae TaxID=418985 RepID=A0A1V9XGU7_9ACAR|nr:myosin regulatory light chain sqh-like [Tropilaelaps mercedesae]